MRIFHISHPRRCGGHAVALWAFRHFDDASYSNSSGYGGYKQTLLRGGGTDIIATFEDDPTIIAQCYVLRDVYNMVASRLRTNDRSRGTPAHGYRPDSLDLWCRFASLPVTFTLFPRFTRDAAYRLAEAQRLELPNPTRDPYIGKPEGWGGGSSFTGVRLHADGMDLEHRYAEYLADPRFRATLNDDRARDLNQRIFGWHLDREGMRNDR